MVRSGRDGGGSLRLFVAVELPLDVKRALESTIASLRTALTSDAMRWVRAEGIHVTLKFLGAVAAERVGAIEAALRDATAGAAPFDLKPGGIGSFGGSGGLRVVWVGIAGEVEQLASLAERVEAALEPLGFARERRPFAAHLTLARVREDASREERSRLYALLAQLAPTELPSFRVDLISLMQSTLSRGGATYHSLSTYALAGEDAS